MPDYFGSTTYFKIFNYIKSIPNDNEMDTLLSNLIEKTTEDALLKIGIEKESSSKDQILILGPVFEISKIKFKTSRDRKIRFSMISFNILSAQKTS